MEAPHKLIELINLDTANIVDLPDRFSYLPEEIILHVFSFLGSNDIARLSYVSRKFRKLCMSCPNLQFELAFDSTKCTANCKALQRFLKGFLNQHNAPEIHRFRLHWFCNSSRYDAKGSVFGMWVQRAMRNKVQELDIGVPVTAGESFYLPAGIQSLRVLKLKLQGGKPKLFASDVFASLEALSLTSVSIPGFIFGDWVCHSCKSLKFLNLENVTGIKNLNISSSSLKVLTVVSCNADEDGWGLLTSRRGHWNYLQRHCIDSKISIHCSSLEKLAISKCEFDNLYLNVNAPSLKDLQISDCKTYGYFDISISAEQLQTLSLTMQLSFCVTKALSFSGCRIYSENLLSLRKATLSLVLWESTFGLGDTIYKEFNTNGLVNFIYSVRYAKILQLNFQIIEALFLEDQLPNLTFEYLEHLEVTIGELNDLDDYTTAIAAFLVECCLSLKTLTLRCDKNASELSETQTELVNQVCSELEKFAAECGYMKITCSVIN
ncbi:hypothetical protein REPUB_Repub10bG0043000 [Reevesia pubescens]